MGVGTYIVHYRAKKREAADEERRRRVEDAKRRPAIVDPSWEILGYKSPLAEQQYDNPFEHDIATTSSTSLHDDWLFQSRRASTMPENYQHSPYCEITPKSSVSSNDSAASDAPVRQSSYDMTWESLPTTVRPRPQSYLPSTQSATYSMSMADLHRSSVYQSRRQDASNSFDQRHDSLPSYDRSQPPQPAYRLEASLTRPFSCDDPLEALSEPVCDSHLYNHGSDAQTKIEEGDGSRHGQPVEHTDDMVKQGLGV